MVNVAYAWCFVCVCACVCVRACVCVCHFQLSSVKDSNVEINLAWPPLFRFFIPFVPNEILVKNCVKSATHIMHTAHGRVLAFSCSSSSEGFNLCFLSSMSLTRWVRLQRHVDHSTTMCSFLPVVRRYKLWSCVLFSFSILFDPQPREKGRMRFHRLQNVQIALDYLKRRQVRYGLPVWHSNHDGDTPR